MSNTAKKIILSGLFLLIYCLLFYFLLAAQLRLDFSSFYAAALAYAQGTNPYKTLVTTYLIIPEKLPANLNPPFFLLLLSPLSHLNFKLASSLWFICSFILGNIGAMLCFKMSFSEGFFKKNRLFLLFIYLGMYSTLMSAGIGQIGGVLLFFIMAGYYFYLQRHDCLAGIFWGVIIAIKLFPALLFIFVFSQKRYKVLFTTSITCLLAFLLPLLVRGKEIYSLYLSLLTRMLWFGDNWNGSLYGFLFRLFVDIKSCQNLEIIQIIYPFLFIILLFWYVKKINSYKTTKTDVPLDHRGFCLTLVMMLLMSPLGWLYYFSLLLMPLTIIWQSFNPEKAISNHMSLWVFSLFLINFPLGYIEVGTMSSVLYKLSIHSLYFYGLVIIAYLLGCLNESPARSIISREEKKMHYLYPVYLSLAFGVFITLTCFIVHLVHTLFPNIPASY